MWKPCVHRVGWATTLVAILFARAPAQAFYWYGWPGSGEPPPRTVVGPPTGKGAPPRVPIGLPGQQSNPPPGGGEGTEPNTTPEPTTGLAALLGVGALAAGRAVRKKRGPVSS